MRIILYTVIGVLIGMISVFLLMVFQHAIWAFFVEIHVLPETSDPDDIVSPIAFLVAIAILLKKMFFKKV